jgi:hypothetical protein
MRIYIKAGDKHYRANVTPEWAQAHDNGRLISCGLTVGEDGFTARMLGYLLRKRRAIEVTEQEWNHSGCQSSCILRGADKCSW